MLAVLGLDQAEETTYAALIDRSPATVSELESSTGLDCVVATLDALEAKGLITRRPGTPARYAAVDPEIALDVLILDREEQLKRARLAAQRFASRFRDTAGQRDPAELLEVVTGLEAVSHRILQLQRTARREVRFIDRPPYVVPVNAMLGTELDQLDRDLCYRGIYDPAGFTDAHSLLGDVRESMSRGEEARLLPNSPVKLLLIDDRYGCLPLQAAPEQMVSMVIVHPSGLLEALSALFEVLWHRALPLALNEDAVIPQDGGPTQSDRHLLTLLAAGVADSAAAKQLDISPRTFQRRIQDLMRRLGTETRFQTGLQAALLGWISR
jgi:hypothetical protein